MSNFYIYIDSDERTSGTASSFSVNLNSFNIQQGANISVSLYECSFYNLQYNINSTNNVITFYEASDTNTLYTATLDEGVYDATDILTEITSKLDAASGNAYTYSAAIGSTTGKLTISTTLPAVFQIVSINLETFGMEPGTAFAATATGTYPINLGGVNYVDLEIPNLINNNITNNANTNNLFKRIPITVAFGSLVSYQSSVDDDAVNVSSEYLNNLRFQIRNPDGSFYDMQNGNISIVLKCKITI